MLSTDGMGFGFMLAIIVTSQKWSFNSRTLLKHGKTYHLKLPKEKVFRTGYFTIARDSEFKSVNCSKRTKIRKHESKSLYNDHRLLSSIN